MPRAAAAGAAMFRPPNASAMLAAGCAALIIAAPSNPIDGSHSAMLAGPFRMATAIRWSFEDSSAATQANSTGVIAGATIATCGACIFWTDFTGKLLRVPAEPTDCGVDSDDPAIAIAPCIELDLSISNGNDDATGAQELSSYSQVPQVRSFDPAVFSGMSSLATLNLGTEYPVAELPETLFRGLGALSSLQFQFHSLASIPEGLFAGLANLTFLGLRENSLSTIPAGSFKNLSKLEYISLRSNGLREVPAGLFDGLSELRELDLLSNTFTELPEGIFDDLVKLEYLRAPNNNLRSMPKQAFKNLGALTWLGLKVNLFQDMPADFLTGLTSLRVLDLSDCWPLGTLPPGFFEPAPKIRALYLARSQITSLPEGIWDPLTDLRVMNLQGNAEDFCYPTPLPDTFPKSVADIDDSIFSEKFPYPLDPLHSDALTQATVGAPACRDDTDRIGAASPPPAAADGALLVDAEQASSTDQQLLTPSTSSSSYQCSCQCSSASATSAAQVVGTIAVDVPAGGSKPRCWCLATCVRTCVDAGQSFKGVGPCT